MNKLICKIFGHKWEYWFPSTTFCKRCNYYPIPGSKEDKRVSSLLAKSKR